ncbi:MAG TPA: thioredoxin-dependent thiol peroxidase [Pyrinomonadaceae bacterium]|nr:thioredoxin-dependent thiol peroxidase [Pyrinomonadaceae bacterium]
MLKVGDKAPAFSLPSDTGETLSLKDFQGKRVILYFYPKDLTSGCTVQACDFRDAQANFKKKKVVILGVSKDPLKKHEAFRKKHDLNFPLLSDEGEKICEKYGVWKEKSMYGRKYMGIERTTFVISPDGKIEHIFNKVKVSNHVDTLLGLF